MIRARETCLVIAVTLALSAPFGPAARGGDGQSPPDTLSSQPTNLLEDLRARARSLDLGDGVEIDAYFSWPLVLWDVRFEYGRVAARLEHETSPGASDARERWLAWYRRVNGQLLHLTASVLSAAGQDLYPETDVCTEFIRGNSESRAAVEVCRFSGSHCGYMESPPPSLPSGSDPETDAGPAGVSLEVEIVPEKSVWRARETITGQVIWRNVGKQRLAMRPISMPRVEVRDSRGAEPPYSPAKVFICFTPLASLPPLVLQAGESREGHFSIDTDPLARGGATLLADGRYELYIRSLRSSLNIPTQVRTAWIEVRTAPDQDLSPRIVWFAAGGSRLVIVREMGAIEAFDIDSGQRVASARIRDYVSAPSYDRSEALSPNGLLYATVRRTEISTDPVAPLEIYSLNGRATLPWS